MLRQINHGLMVQWINADLMNRAANDVRQSVVLYDSDQMFVAALPAGTSFTPGTLENLYELGIRYQSKGIV